VVPQLVEDGCGVSLQALVPLQLRVMQAVDAQSTVVPTQLLPEQASLYVQALPSSQVAFVRHSQLPPWFVQRQVLPPQPMVWHRLWVEPSQVYDVPPPQVPLALLAPHPEQARPVCSRCVPQVSAQAPAVVPQPPPPLHVTVQHWLEPPAWQVVGEAPHEQVSQTSPPPLQYRVQLPG
jgi:hypothetical protein